ncbi:Platz transcription factor family protein [Thalictrum thalictroides]|uniref:Platz transcription factor family protein n=1 Tax=Thalictrum thalictroides TaxID=46969 RepID=A0A7J6VZK7_THATH|nr:Platz transcription factor family protein [Thalictrum thalictroides]
MEKNLSIHPAHEQRRARAMKTLKKVMLKLAMSRDPSRFKSQHELMGKHIDVRLPYLFPYPLRTPNHPPYVDMILRAVKELNKGTGATKESISNFIKSNNQDLPLAHKHLVTNHLMKLVQEGTIVSVTKSLYALPNCNNIKSEKQQEVGAMISVQKDVDDLGLPWLNPMLKATYFIACEFHWGSGCDMFCLDCMGNPFCSHCLRHHEDHHVVRIHSSNSNNGIKVDDIQKYIDISGVQTFISRRAENIVYLNKRPHFKSFKRPSTCEICCRSLPGSFRFCSLSCKVRGGNKSIKRETEEKHE